MGGGGGEEENGLESFIWQVSLTRLDKKENFVGEYALRDVFHLSCRFSLRRYKVFQKQFLKYKDFFSFEFSTARWCSTVSLCLLIPLIFFLR